MGIYAIDCTQCKKPFMWFSGNTGDQRCEECRKPKHEPPICPTCKGKDPECPWEPELPTDGQVSTIQNLTKTTEAPREFWIVRNPVTDEHVLHLVKPSWKSIPLGFERIHVIERSAYEELERENLLITEREADFIRTSSLEWSAVKEKLERELAEARAEVKA